MVFVVFSFIKLVLFLQKLENKDHGIYCWCSVVDCLELWTLHRYGPRRKAAWIPLNCASNMKYDLEGQKVFFFFIWYETSGLENYITRFLS